MNNLMNNIMFRLENPIDVPKIDKLLRAVFKRGAEADLVQQLRKHGLLALEIVAADEKDGTVVGYAAFSQVQIENNNDSKWVALAPLAVEESWRRQGFGTKLITEALNSLNEFEYTGVVVLGDPAYYSKLGFIPAVSHQLSCRWPGSKSTFQVFPLAKDALSGISGQVIYSQPFDCL